MKTSLAIALICLHALPGLRGGDLHPEIKTRIIKILVASAGLPSRINCKEPALMAELAKAGFTNDPGAVLAYAASEAELKALKGPGKLVLCGRADLLPLGGAVAIVEEDNRPQIIYHMAVLGTSKVVLSDAVLKIGRKL